MRFKFGDMVRNDWVSDDNPYQVRMFVYYTTRKSGPFSTTRFAVLAKDGKKFEHDASDPKLVVTGNVFEEIAMLREKTKEAEERGVRALAQIISMHGINGSYPTSDGVEQLVQLWKEARGK